MRKENLQPARPLCDPLTRRVVVLRALQLGDLLCAIPAFRALRAALPRAEIVLLGLPWARTLVERFPRYLDGFLEFPGYPGLPERTCERDQVPAFLARVQQGSFDLAIQMHGNGTITNPLAVLLGALRTAGFFTPGGYCPEPGCFLPYPANEPEIWRCLRLMDFLGAPPCGEELEFPVRDEDEQALREVGEAADLHPGEYICLHPGARAAWRRWPPEYFATVADRLAVQGLRIVLTGSREEAVLTQAVRQAMRAPAIDLAGRTSLGALAVLLRSARLLVCNDTGVSHLAAALRVPSVVIFHQMSESEGWPPLDRQRHRVVCGLRGVTPEAVLAQAEDLLAISNQQSAISGSRVRCHPPTEASFSCEALSAVRDPHAARGPLIADR